ncbi:TolC family outer membrane protein [Loktanella sp. DJP18]|uniref:TolC family outer membrane protein n=1 Tax=Loktanella sp. DJP18 TaxID=3409788 RepID=UPI003BB76C6A
MTLRRILRQGAAILCLTLSATALSAETIAQALADAYDGSGLLAQNRAVLRAADEDVAQATSRLLPVISWAASADNQSPRTPGSDAITGSLSLSASLTIYDGGANQLAIAAQKALVLGTRESLRDVEQQVLLRTVQAYMSVRSTAEFISLRQNNLRVLNQELRAAQDRFDVGEVTRTDVALAQASVASAQSLLTAAQGDARQAAAEFAAAIGREPGDLVDVSPAPVSTSEAEAVALALRNHPAVLQAQYAVSANELAIARAKAAYRPQASVNAQLGMDFDGNVGRTVGVSIGGPIYSGGAIPSTVRQAMAQRDQARAVLHLASVEVRQQVANAYAALQVARASLQSTDEQVRAARVAFEGIREEATLGARTTLDVLNAEQTLLNARANVITAQEAEVNASYAVLAATGLLTATHLNLAVQQYDPAAYYNLVKDAPAALSEQGQALDRVLRAIGQ